MYVPRHHLKMRIFAVSIFLICVCVQFVWAIIDQVGESSGILPANENVVVSEKLIEMSPKEVLAKAVNDDGIRGDPYYYIKDKLAKMNIPGASANDFEFRSSSTMVNIKYANWVIKEVTHLRNVLLEKAKLYEENSELDRKCDDGGTGMLTYYILVDMYGNFAKYNNEEVIDCMNNISKMMEEKCIQKDSMKQVCSLYSFICGVRYKGTWLHSIDNDSV